MLSISVTALHEGIVLISQLDLLKHCHLQIFSCHKYFLLRNMNYSHYASMYQKTLLILLNFKSQRCYMAVNCTITIH